jgi:hypothetical protein
MRDDSQDALSYPSCPSCESVSVEVVKVPKGQDQVAEAAALCRAMAGEVAGLEGSAEEQAGLRAELEALGARLEALRNKFFVKMAPALRYTGACLAAATALKAAFAPGVAAGALGEPLAALEAAAKTLEDRAGAAGSMTIT